jgi:hypothetical protein
MFANARSKTISEELAVLFVQQEIIVPLTWFTVAIFNHDFNVKL